MKSPEEVIGADAVLALQFAGYKIVRDDQPASLIESTPDDFDVLWASYPHKVAKEAARRAYTAARRAKFSRDFIFSVLREYVENKSPSTPWMNLATFLNGRRWNDAPAMVSAPVKGADLFFQSAATGDRNGYSGGNQGTARHVAGGVLAIPDHSGHR